MLGLTARQEIIADVRGLLKELDPGPTWGTARVTSSTELVTSVVLQSVRGAQPPEVRRELQVIIQSDHTPLGFRVVARAERHHRSDRGTTRYQKARTVGFVPGLDDFDALRRMAREGITLVSSWQTEDLVQSGC